MEEKMIKFNEVYMRKHYGYTIVERYRYCGLQERPICVARWKGQGIGISGYIYVYPSKKCAEGGIMQLRSRGFKGDYRTKRVLVQDVEKK